MESNSGLLQNSDIAHETSSAADFDEATLMELFSEPCKSVEGWVVFISGLHPESQEDDVKDACSDYGKVTNIQMNLDRRTGFVKGYALVEFGDRVEAERAIEGLNGSKLLGKLIRVDWAFIGKSNMDVSSGNSLRKKHKPHHEQSNE